MRKALAAVAVAAVMWVMPAQAATLFLDFNDLTEADLVENALDNGVVRINPVYGAQFKLVQSADGTQGLESFATISGTDPFIYIHAPSWINRIKVEFTSLESKIAQITSFDQYTFLPNGFEQAEGQGVVTVDMHMFSKVAQLDILGGKGPIRIDNLTIEYGEAPLVPEPATWAMMLAGFGLVGGAVRRSRVPFQNDPAIAARALRATSAVAATAGTPSASAAV